MSFNYSGLLFIGITILIGSGDAQTKPHMIVIHLDDMGHWDIGYNNPEVITPNLDQLARQGVILENNYHMQLCTPSRAAFMTGMHNHRTTMQGGYLNIGTPHCLPTNIPTLPEYLKLGGYQTHLIGKWHLGFCQWNCTPTYRGFDTFFGMYGGQQDYFTHEMSGGYDWTRDKITDLSANGTYVTDLIRDETMSKIADYSEGDDPLFMWLAFTYPHDPLQIDYQQFLDLYPQVEEPRRTYLAMISYGDMVIGEMVRLLIHRGMWDNTFLFFSSDNGGNSIALGGSNHPYRGMKGALFEGSTKVVGFATGPLLNQTNYVHDGLFSVLDLMPTLMSIAGMDPETVSHLDGFDQSDMLLNGGASRRVEVIYSINLEEPAFSQFGDAAIRYRDMKLIWGIPGEWDGYGHDIKDIYDMDYWLAFINKTADNETGGFRSAEDTENLIAIHLAQGLTNMTRDRISEGHVMLFNITADPYEMNNLRDDPDYQSWIMFLKSRVMDVVDEGYTPLGAQAFADVIHLAEEGMDEYGAWVPGWCNDFDQTI